MDIDSLAYYAGYAFCQAVQVQHIIASEELMVPFVVYWDKEIALPVPYPAHTQEQAVELALEARKNRQSDFDGWSSGREGLVDPGDGVKRDVLLIEAAVPGLDPPLALIHYYKKSPFALDFTFMWKNHPQVRKSREEILEFAPHFKRGILGHPFGDQCLDYIAASKKQDAHSNNG